MRATCEHCAAHQPPSWVSGDLCSSCGHAVRHEVRCFWCATWTPAAAFCRTCGADIVDERLYGAARMLKDAGTDRFTVPKQLIELGADRIENFARIYQRHAAVAAHHVDALHAVERHLHDQRWSAALDDELAGQLPWTPERLVACEAGVGRHAAAAASDDPRAQVREIRLTTPFDRTRDVAALAQVQLGDLSAFDDVRALLHGGEPAVRAEAALVLGSWRVRTVHDLRSDSDAIVVELRTSSFTAAAGVRLAALLGRPELLPPEELLGHDPEAMFDAALQRVDIDRLSTALGGDPVECIAAARSLTSAGAIAPLDRPLRTAADDVRLEVLHALQRSKRQCNEVHDALVEIAIGAGDRAVRRVATSIACRSMTHGSALRIARSSLHGVTSGDRLDQAAILQSLLQCELLGGDTIVEIADLMLAAGRFTMQQYGLWTVADDGRLPDWFVPARFDGADESTRRELLAVAEHQLGARADEDLHRFALRTLFGPHPAETRAAAMWVLRRWYRQEGDVRGEGTFVLERAAVEQCFGGLDRFVTGLCGVLGDDATMREVGISEYLAHLLSTTDDALVAALQHDRIGQRLVDTLATAVSGDYWSGTLEAMWTLLSRLAAGGADEHWRAMAVDALGCVDRAGNHHFDRALERLRADH